MCLLKHHGVTVGERGNVKESKPDTKSPLIMMAIRFIFS